MGDMREFLRKRREAKESNQANPSSLITHACGHTAAVERHQGQSCPDCLGQKRKHKSKQRRQQWEQRLAQRQREQNDRRLPHGSSFTMTYDGVAREWQGTLSIPDGPSFYASSTSGLFKLLDLLDQIYRQSLTKGPEHDNSSVG